MVVHFGKAQVLKRQMAQALHGLIGRELALANLVKQFTNRLGIQGSTQHSAQ
jgi:hypothetical protein